MRPLALVMVMCAGLACASSKSSTPAPATGLGVVWTADTANPQHLDGVCPSWHCAASSDPAIAIAADGSLSLWFSTVGIVSNGTGGYTSNLNIGHAVAADSSPLAFSLSPDAPVLSSPAADGIWDRYLETVSVLYDPAASNWKMWFLGYAEEGFVSPALGEMESGDADGTVWERPAAPIYRPTAGAWDSALISGPTGMQGPDGVFRVYYSGVSPTTGETGVGLLTSTDGQTWTPSALNPVFPNGGPGAWDETNLEQTVRFFNGHYWMWYSGYRGTVLTTATQISIGLATSDDSTLR